MHTPESAPKVEAPPRGGANHSAGSGQLYDPFPASIRGVDAGGESFLVETVLDSLGPGVLQVRLGREVREGARLFALIRLSDAAPAGGALLRLAVRGVAARVERRQSRAYCVTVSITSRRLL